MSASIRPTTSAPRRVLLLVLLHVQLDNLVALMPAPFGVTTPRAAQQATAPRRRRSTLRSTWPRCCICINCKFVDRCKTYHWVEERHEQPHVSEQPDFELNYPKIQVAFLIALFVPRSLMIDHSCVCCAGGACEVASEMI